MEKKQNEIARLSRYFAALSERAVPTDICYDAERIFDAARGEASPAECREIVDHMVDCPVCAEAWRLAFHIDYADQEAQTLAPVLAFSPASKWMTAVAAMLLLAVLGGNLSFLFQPEALYRDLQTRPAEIELAQDIAVSQEGFTLRWQVLPESASQNLTYRVEIKTQQGLRDVLEVWDLEEEELHVDSRQIQDFPPGTVLIWQVDAVSEDGHVYRSYSQILRLP